MREEKEKIIIRRKGRKTYANRPQGASRLRINAPFIRVHVKLEVSCYSREPSAFMNLRRKPTRENKNRRVHLKAISN